MLEGVFLHEPATAAPLEDLGGRTCRATRHACARVT
jgi:hypothetical protein